MGRLLFDAQLNTASSNGDELRLLRTTNNVVHGMWLSLLLTTPPSPCPPLPMPLVDIPRDSTGYAESSSGSTGVRVGRPLLRWLEADGRIQDSQGIDQVGLLENGALASSELGGAHAAGRSRGGK